MNPNIRALTVSSLLLAAALATQEPAAQQPEKHLLRLRFMPYQTLYQVITSDVKSSTSIGGRDMSMDMRMTMDVEAQVGELRDGLAEVSHKVTRLRVKTDSDVLKVDYDSADPDSDLGMLGDLADMLDRPMRANIDARGRMHALELPEAVGGQLSRMFGQRGMSSLFDQFHTMLPEDPVAVGETWEEDTKLSMPQLGEMRTKVTHKLVKLEDSKAYIEQAMQVQIDMDDMPLLGGMKFATDACNGSLVVDLATGQIVECTMSMTMHTEPGEDAPMPMKMQMKTTTSMKSVPPPEPKKLTPTKEGKDK